uniref:Uncharacterized protein n=1 Tax=Arundo donax TaxID=35708 RepID=A0A0A9G8C3_ARUDO
MDHAVVVTREPVRSRVRMRKSHNAQPLRPSATSCHTAPLPPLHRIAVSTEQLQDTVPY